MREAAPTAALWRVAAAVWLYWSWRLFTAPLGEPSSFFLPFDLARLPAADKLAHGALFFVTAFLLHRAFGGRLAGGAVLVVVAVCALWGVLTEIGQLDVPGRRAELADVFADWAGSGTYVAVAWWRRW